MLHKYFALIYKMKQIKASYEELNSLFFFQFLSAIDKFLFLKWRTGSRLHPKFQKGVKKPVDRYLKYSLMLEECMLTQKFLLIQVKNSCLTLKHKIVFFEKCDIQLFVTSHFLITKKFQLCKIFRKCELQGEKTELERNFIFLDNF